MIPLRDIVPSRTRPYVTVTIIVLNVAAFLFELSLPPDTRQAFLQAFGVVPAAFTWPTVFTSMFLHAGWLHIGGNMLYLWIFGDNVEDRVGHGRFLLFYLLCGTVAALGQVFANPLSAIPTIGASGAIAGVMGAYIVLYPRSQVLTLIPLIIFWEIIEVPAIFFLGFWFLLQLISVGVVAQSTQGGGVAFWAHIAGFLTGMGLVQVLKRPERERVEWWSQ
ncbi:MAG TPA: rhomboid family intramembrane serine protease [Vicinamibacterales bacterium]|nr:rhomboid family intramembrane serine protease [Vicinamibacterales bacterium]